MDMKLELVPVPVTDVDRAKAFYVDQLGFNADFDQVVNEGLRFVQLTPPGSACSIVLGIGITEMTPGSQKGLMLVVEDVAATRQELIGRGVETGDIDAAGVGIIHLLQRSRRQHLDGAAAPEPRGRGLGQHRPEQPRMSSPRCAAPQRLGSRGGRTGRVAASGEIRRRCIGDG